MRQSSFPASTSRAALKCPAVSDERRHPDFPRAVALLPSRRLILPVERLRYHLARQWLGIAGSENPAAVAQDEVSGWLTVSSRSDSKFVMHRLDEYLHVRDALLLTSAIKPVRFTLYEQPIRVGGGLVGAAFSPGLDVAAAEGSTPFASPSPSAPHSGVAAIDMRTPAAREMVAFRDALVAAIGGDGELSVLGPIRLDAL
jgi:hypothetical protein